MHVSCSCDVHRRCALGFVKDAMPRLRVNGDRLRSRTRPYIHAVHQEVDLHTLFQQIRGLGGLTDTAMGESHTCQGRRS